MSSWTSLLRRYQCVVGLTIAFTQETQKLLVKSFGRAVRAQTQESTRRWRSAGPFIRSSLACWVQFLGAALAKIREAYLDSLILRSRMDFRNSFEMKEQTRPTGPTDCGTT